jgi:glycerophosphoryl diester phosphodiesterase
MKPWLIAHRGVRNEARENTKAAFAATKNYPLGWVELDIHKTLDDIVITHHDADIWGVSIKHTRFEDLKKADPELTTFTEALKQIGELPIILEIKSKNTAPLVLEHIENNKHWRVASFHASELHSLVSLGVDKKRLFLLQRKQPIRHLHRANKAQFGGIGVNKYYLTPFFYWRSRRHGFQLYTYTVNSVWLARIFRLLYPDVDICTDVPQKLKILS